jgi:hypothetical protein
MPTSVDPVKYSTWFKRSKDLRILSTALKSYKEETNKPVEQFEEDYGCKIAYGEDGNISGVSFVNKSAESMFYLKYDKAS